MHLANFAQNAHAGLFELWLIGRLGNDRLQRILIVQECDHLFILVLTAVAAATDATVATVRCCWWPR